MLVELPLTFAAYMIVAALVLPRGYWTNAWPLAVLMPLGLAASVLMSLAISLPRLRLLAIPACAWAYALLSAGTVPFLLWIQEGRVALLVLGGQVWAAFWADAWLARALEARGEGRP